MGIFGKKKETETSEEDIKKLLDALKKKRVEGKKEEKKKGSIIKEEYPIHPHEGKLERPVKLDEYDPVKRMGKFQKLKHKIKGLFHSGSGLLINMELVVGDHLSFIVWEKDGGFKFHGGKFLFDHESKYYNVSAKMWCYDYHEKFSLPIKRRFPYREFRDTVKNEAPNMELATNPDSLEEFINAKIIEGIMKGAGLEAFLRRLFFISLINLIILIGFVIMFAAKTGMFDKVKIPGLG